MNSQLNILRKEKADLEIVDCTFKPKLITANYQFKDPTMNVRRPASHDVTKRLYSNAMNKLLRIKSIYKEKESLNDSFKKYSKECTFSPSTKKL